MTNKTDITQYELFYDNVLLKAVEIESVEGLVKPDQYEDKPEFGVVIAVGEGRLMDSGTIVPMKVKVGDTVLFGMYSTEKIRNEGIDYYIIREVDIKGKAK